MSKFFRILAIILLIISVFFFLAGLINLEEYEAVFIMFSAFGGIVAGLALHTVGDLLDRVNYLEDKLNMHLPIDSEDDLPQVKCNNCGKEYDMDYPSCPYCGKKTEFEHN